MTRVYNFSAGPAAIPEAVLAQARDDMLDWNGTGMSVMEISHRSKEFIAVAEQAEQDLRDLLDVPDNYRVLFLQGGATLQFAMVPFNLSAPGQRVDYVNTGSWSKKAIAEASRYCDVNVVASGENRNFTYVPPQSEWQLSEQPAYLHLTTNETIGGVEFHWLPDVGDVPLVADMSSTILSRPVDISRFGVIYAGAQKNIGPAGLTLAIVRNDLLERARSETPSLLDYSVYAESGSMTNTPPTFAWYMAGLVFAWLKEQGGLQAMEAINSAKAAKLYAAIDDSDFYSNPVEPASRSWMNVPFILADAELDKLFLQEAASAGLTTLKGHRSVGGMRASIYNAMPAAGVAALVDFMGAFAQRHG